MFGFRSDLVPDFVFDAYVARYFGKSILSEYITGPHEQIEENKTLEEHKKSIKTNFSFDFFHDYDGVQFIADEIWCSRAGRAVKYHAKVNTEGDLMDMLFSAARYVRNAWRDRVIGSVWRGYRVLSVEARNLSIAAVTNRYLVLLDGGSNNYEVYRWETGERLPHVLTYSQFCSLFGVVKEDPWLERCHSSKDRY